MVDVVKPSTVPSVAGKSYIASSLGFNAFTRDRVPFSILTNFESIRDNIRNILFFRKGDYPDSPDFGVGIQDYLFEQNDELLKIALSQEIRRQIATYEPRVTIRTLSVSTPSWADDSIVVDLDLLVNGTSLSGLATSSGTFNLSQQAAA